MRIDVTFGGAEGDSVGSPMPVPVAGTEKKSDCTRVRKHLPLRCAAFGGTSAALAEPAPMIGSALPER